MSRRHSNSALHPIRRRARTTFVVGLVLALGASTGVADAQVTGPDKPAAAQIPKPKHVPQRKPLPAMKGPSSARGGTAKTTSDARSTADHVSDAHALAHPAKLATFS